MTMHASPYFSDAEVDEMTQGLEQDAAKIRFLRSIGLRVHRKPNGKPLAWRPAAGGPVIEGTADAQNEESDDDSLNIVGLRSWAANRKGRNGQKTQGR